jgi:transketolase
MEEFRVQFPERFIEVGVAAQNLATLSAGLALAGKIPFAASYAAFSPGRNWEQIRTNIALSATNVKLVGSHAGFSVGSEGATHQALEDIALMRVMPNMRVFSPADSVQAERMTLAIAKSDGPAYLRLARSATPVFTTDKTPFEIGRGQLLFEGSQAAIIATGQLVHQALLVAHELEEDGVSVQVINMPTIKPLDIEIILQAAETGAVVTVEEGQISGGLGGAVAEVLSENCPIPLRRLGVRDRFGESGSTAELLEAHELTAKFIKRAVVDLLPMRDNRARRKK